MKTIFTDDYDKLSQAAARHMAALFASKPDAAVCVATGNTPGGAYAHLANMKDRGAFDTSKLKAFQLDEYLGLKHGDERTLWGWMDRIFVTPLGITEQNIYKLDCQSTDPAATGAAFDAAIASVGGFDLCILGLGPNGHLGFNEPPSPPDSTTREVTLTEESLESNSVYWGGREQVPLQAMTVGMSQILNSREILLLVSGRRKISILERALKGPITEMLPASFLQSHPNTVLFVDREACGEQAQTSAESNPR